MKKINLMIILLILAAVSAVQAEDRIYLNVINQPGFDFFSFAKFNRRFAQFRSDSLVTANFFTGKILDKAKSDIYLLAFLNSVDCDFACPTDYNFRSKNLGMDFKLLASNIDTDSLAILDNVILESDSIRVGIFSLYTPDFAVKNELPNKLELDTEVFKVAYKQAKILAISCDYVIMFSNLGKFIDNDVVRNLDVDAVISFDYQKKDNGLLSNRKTSFYSLIDGSSQIGRLELVYINGKLEDSWRVLEY